MDSAWSSKGCFASGVSTTVPVTTNAAPTFILEISWKFSKLSWYTTCRVEKKRTVVENDEAKGLTGPDRAHPTGHGDRFSCVVSRVTKQLPNTDGFHIHRTSLCLNFCYERKYTRNLDNLQGEFGIFLWDGPPRSPESQTLCLLYCVLLWEMLGSLPISSKFFQLSKWQAVHRKCQTAKNCCLTLRYATARMRWCAGPKLVSAGLPPVLVQLALHLCCVGPSGHVHRKLGHERHQYPPPTQMWWRLE